MVPSIRRTAIADKCAVPCRTPPTPPSTRSRSTKDGKLVVAGKTVSSLSDATTGRFGVVIGRYNTNGTLDKTFNGNGFLSLFTPINAPAAPADADLTSQFQAFTAASVGIVDLTPGGGILTLASTPTNQAASSTTVSVASVVPDGPNITPSLKLLATPASVLSGAQGKASLTITNTGTLPLNGAIPVTLYLSSDTIRSADDHGLPAIHVSVNLAPKKSKAMTISFTFPKNLPTGKYFLLADVNASGAIAEINSTDDQVAARSAVKVAQAAANVQVKFVTQPPVVIKAGKPAPISLLLTNTGNITATGNGSLQFLASSDRTLDSADVSLMPPKTVKLSLKPHASTKVNLTLLVKSSMLPAGMDFLVASIRFQGKTLSVFSNSLLQFP